MSTASPLSVAVNRRRPALIAAAFLLLAYGAGVGTASLFDGDSDTASSERAEVLSPQPNVAQPGAANAPITTTMPVTTTVGPEVPAVASPAPAGPAVVAGGAALPAAPVVQAAQSAPASPAQATTTTTTAVALPGSVNQLPPGALLPPSSNSPISIDETDVPPSGVVVTTIPVRPSLR